MEKEMLSKTTTLDNLIETAAKFSSLAMFYNDKGDFDTADEYEYKVDTCIYVMRMNHLGDGELIQDEIFKRAEPLAYKIINGKINKACIDCLNFGERCEGLKTAKYDGCCYKPEWR